MEVWAQGSKLEPMLRRSLGTVEKLANTDVIGRKKDQIHN